MTVTVMMYHAVEDSQTTGADPHYTVSVDGFKRHLSLYKRLGLAGRSVRDLLAPPVSERAVALTFDDGHQSNLRAAQLLAEANMTADFFVNPAMVGAPGFLGWDELKQMHEMGMSIQSHGMTHRYLNDLPIVVARSELMQSRAEIESRLGADCTIFAPPGGREPAGFGRLLHEAGYRAACTSQPGYWEISAQSPFIPRFAVLAATGEHQLEQWAGASRLALLKIQCRSGALGVVKRAVGNQRYEQWRARVLGG